MLSSKAGSGNQQIWVAKGRYTPPEFFRLLLPKSGAIVGGFNAENLPNDSNIAQRDLSKDSTIVGDYRIAVALLDGSLEMNGLYFSDSKLEVTTDGSGFVSGSTFRLNRCVILGLGFPQDYWSVGGEKTIKFQMIDSKVLNNLLSSVGWPSNWWRISFDAAGSFLARNTEFTRVATTESDYHALLTTAFSEAEFIQEFRFDNCKLNYFVDTDETGISGTQLFIDNPNATLFTTNSVITGGTPTIQYTNWPDRR